MNRAWKRLERGVQGDSLCLHALERGSPPGEGGEVTMGQREAEKSHLSLEIHRG